VPAFAIEGTGSYGAGLVRHLEGAGLSVYECERPRRQERRGKTSARASSGRMPVPTPVGPRGAPRYPLLREHVGRVRAGLV
jgi:hypothetical protein